MKDAIFSDMFRFYEITREKYHYSDNRSGSPEHYLAYMMEGHCKIVSEKQTIRITEGDLFYIPIGLPYQSYWYGDRNNHIRFLSLGFRWFPEAETATYSLQLLPHNDEWTELMQSIPVNTHLNAEAVGRFYTMLSQLLPSLEKTSANNRSHIVRQAKAYMYRRTEATACEIAQHCGVSESTLYTIFKELLGKTPNTVKQEMLCEKAVFLLSATDKSVQEISDILGFSSPSYFRKVLKAHTDSTPREIRRRFLTV